MADKNLRDLKEHSAKTTGPDLTEFNTRDTGANPFCEATIVNGSFQHSMREHIRKNSFKSSKCDQQPCE